MSARERLPERGETVTDEERAILEDLSREVEAAIRKARERLALVAGVRLALAERGDDRPLLRTELDLGRLREEADIDA